MISRAELDELYRADDEVRAEHAEWLARREAQARPFVRKSEDPAGLIFKTVENAPPPPPQPNGAAPDVLSLLDEFSGAATDKFRRVDREFAELRAKIDTLTAIIAGDKSKAADVIDLPDWRRRDVA
jgi:hypothetical protein